MVGCYSVTCTFLPPSQPSEAFSWGSISSLLKLASLSFLLISQGHLGVRWGGWSRIVMSLGLWPQRGTPTSTCTPDTTFREDRDFPGRPVVKTLRFHCRSMGLIPGWEVKIPHAAWCDQKKKKKDIVSQRGNKRKRHLLEVGGVERGWGSRMEEIQVIGCSTRPAVHFGFERGEIGIELMIQLSASKCLLRDFPGGPVGKTPCSLCRGPGFNPWLGN